MTKLTIRTIPDPVLRQKAAEVATVDKETVAFMRDMVETMYADQGIGLAANQVGVLQRIITIDISEERDGAEALLMANPKVVWASEETFTYKEGCLSVRPTPDESKGDYYADVTRPKKIRVTYVDEHNKPREIEAEDLLSICIQHEIDHLDGILFIDYLSPLKRNIIKRKIEKARKHQEED